MLAFIRGPGTFVSPGQVYVKMLPNGEPVAVTHDNARKLHTEFSPDGSRVSYTVDRSERVVGHVDGSGAWGRAAVVADERQRTYVARQRSACVFGNQDRHSHGGGRRGGEPHGTARRLRSTDRAWDGSPVAGVAGWEVGGADGDGCARVAAVQGCSTGRQFARNRDRPRDGRVHERGVVAGRAVCVYELERVGPAADMASAISRTGSREQVTFGPAEAAGIAVAPDGSVVTSIGLSQGSIWLRENGEDRQVSGEGDAALPAWGDGFPSSVFSPDGSTFYYLVKKGASRGFAAANCGRRI